MLVVEPIKIEVLFFTLLSLLSCFASKISISFFNLNCFFISAQTGCILTFKLPKEFVFMFSNKLVRLSITIFEFEIFHGKKIVLSNFSFELFLYLKEGTILIFSDGQSK